jgi:hypothetical protein
MDGRFGCGGDIVGRITGWARRGTTASAVVTGSTASIWGYDRWRSGRLGRVHWFNVGRRIGSSCSSGRRGRLWRWLFEFDFEHDSSGQITQHLRQILYNALKVVLVEFYDKNDDTVGIFGSSCSNLSKSKKGRGMPLRIILVIKSGPGDSPIVN